MALNQIGVQQLNLFNDQDLIMRTHWKNLIFLINDKMFSPHISILGIFSEGCLKRAGENTVVKDWCISSIIMCGTPNNKIHQCYFCLLTCIRDSNIKYRTSIPQMKSLNCLWLQKKYPRLTHLRISEIVNNFFQLRFCFINTLHIRKSCIGFHGWLHFLI